MEDVEASKLTDLTADIMMVMGRMRGSANHPDRGAVHPGTEYAVLDTILRHGKRTVPEIAAWRGVTRQSVQAVVNKLVDTGLLSQHENPEHKSSKLLDVEPAGQQQYELSREQMCARYRSKQEPLAKGDLDAAARVLAVIAGTWGMEVNGETE